jgi:surface protein
MSIIKRKAGSEDIVKSVLEFDDVPTEGSHNLVESGAVAAAIGNLASSVIAATALGEESMMANLPIADNTLRFSFGDLDYDPIVAGVGSSGAWTKKNTKFTNVWDWTNENTDWHEAFKGAFPDVDNPVKVIAAGDTSSVINFKDMFGGIRNNQAPSSGTYVLYTRNNIVSCVPFDISGCTGDSNNSIMSLFFGSSLKEYVQFTFPEDWYQTCQTVFADTEIEEIGDVYLQGHMVNGVFSHCMKLKKVGNVTYKLQEGSTFAVNIFANSNVFDAPLEEVGNIQGNATDFSTLFQACKHLKKVGSIDCTNTYSFLSMFSNCNELEEIPELTNIGNTNITNTYQMFSNCWKLKQLPVFDTSHVTNATRMLRNCYELTSIPDYDFNSVVGDVQEIALSCYKVKTGILEAYNKLLARGSAITNHTDCFKDCGRDTEEGRAALAQIPVSWGGTMETA